MCCNASSIVYTTGVQSNSHSKDETMKARFQIEKERQVRSNQVSSEIKKISAAIENAKTEAEEKALRKQRQVLKAKLWKMA